MAYDKHAQDILLLEGWVSRSATAELLAELNEAQQRATSEQEFQLAADLRDAKVQVQALLGSSGG